MADNSEQRNLQALLRFAATAGSHGSEPSEGTGVNSTSEDRAWLSEAVRNFSSERHDPIQYIKEQLSKVYRYLKKSEADGDATALEDVYRALEGVLDNCDQFDLATDLHKVGGFDVMIQCMQHQDSGICWRACDVLATASQNHEYCQKALLEMNALPIMLNLVDNTSADNEVRKKAFYALSCLLRGNENALEYLEKSDGLSTLIRAMQSDVPKLKIKSTFLMRALCEGDSKYSSILHQRGIEQQIVGMLRNQNVDDNPQTLTILEGLLGCLHSLISTSGECRNECRDPSFSLSPLVRQLKAKFSSGGEEYAECIVFCDKILISCFQDEDDADDR